MTLIDLTGGAGFGFGALWPSANATSVSTQLPDAVDGVGGGTYAGDIVWSGDHTFNGDLDGTTTGGTLDLSATALTLNDPDLDGLLNMNAAGSGIAYRTATLGDADANLTVAVDEYNFTAVPLAARTYTLLDVSAPVPVDGQRIRIVQQLGGGAANATFQRETGPATVAQLLAGAQGSIEFTFHAGTWKVSASSANVTVPPH